MKWLAHSISDQHFYLKTAVFITGLAIGLDSSLRQLVIQLLLLLVILAIEPSLYLLFLRALKKLLPFFAAYWIFATLFAQDFLTTVFFSVQILYLIAVTVYVLGKVHLAKIAAESYGLRRWKLVNSLFYYLIATVYFIRAFFAEYKSLKLTKGSNLFLAQISEILNRVSLLSPQIHESVTELLNSKATENTVNLSANYMGILLLALMVIVHSL